MSARNWAGVIILGWGLAACKVGPDYTPPVAQVGGVYDGVDESSVLGTGWGGDAWWEGFGDPALTRCVEAALKSNRDLAVARQRVRVARALRRMESSRFWPNVDARVSYTVDRMSENNPRFGEAIQADIFPRDVEYWDAGFDLTWELDLFGGTQRAVQGAGARIEAEEFQGRALMLTVAAEVVRNYFELQGNRERLELVVELLATRTLGTRILTLKQEAGLIAEDRVLESLARRQQREAVVPGIRAEIRAGQYRLAVLMGRRPNEGIPELVLDTGLPSPSGRVPVGLPSDLLRRRPDILAAERRLAAATADIGVATSEFFPRFYLTGSPNLQSGDFSDLFNGASSAWQFGPSFTWKIFSAGRLKAQLEAARAQREQVFVEYEATVNRALEEVESSLVRYANDALSLSFLTQAMESEEKRLAIQRRRHRQGILAEVDVLDSHTAWLEARLARLDREILLLTRLTALHKALGGGWHTAEAIGMTSPEEAAD